MEAEGLQFSHLWVMGLSEQNWPAPAALNPFIPAGLQRRHSIPAADAAVHTRQAREQLEGFISASARQVILSHPRQDEEGNLNPCAFFHDVPGTTVTLDSVPALPLHPAIMEQLAGRRLEVFSEPAELALGPGEQVRGGTSLIADQAACPFRSFSLHRLDARELPALSFGLPAYALGNMLHTALELLWRELRDQSALTSRSVDQLHELMQDVAASAVKQTAKRFPHTMTPHFCSLEINRLQSLLQQWLEQERNRGHFSIAAVEHELQWRHARLLLNFRIDRIDQLDDGSFALVDYKSSRNNTVTWDDPRQDKPQLPLYLLAAQEQPQYRDITAVLYAQVNIEDMKYTGLCANEEIYPGLSFENQRRLAVSSWQELKEMWQLSLQNLADEFLAGHAVVSPKTRTTCQYCHLSSLCRIGELPL